jgi:hypothetical protein
MASGSVKSLARSLMPRPSRNRLMTAFRQQAPYRGGVNLAPVLSSKDFACRTNTPSVMGTYGPRLWYGDHKQAKRVPAERRDFHLL